MTAAAPAVLDRHEIAAWYRGFQDRFCVALETIDGSGSFAATPWDRPGGGGGETRMFTGDVIEKAAVNFSAVHGDSPESLRSRYGSDAFFATGVSIIVHPANPYAPTFHANVRYFETGDDAWFGGGCDLTPWYLFDIDAEHFHTTISDVCDAHAVADYDAWKRACDEYFHLPHRGEARGIGGVFFDHLDPTPDVRDFQRDLADALVDAYIPLLERRIVTPFGARERQWHETRRGRYVEFNLVWDRGTRFGLETGGRTASILASLPPAVQWPTEVTPRPGSREARLVEVLSGPPRDWVGAARRRAEGRT